MRIVGSRNRSEIELDPVEAYRRGARLDRMLRDSALPVQRGIQRGSHAYFQRLDQQRQAAVARRVNPE